MDDLLKTKQEPVAIEKAFDVPVKTPPLQHVTKGRVKNTTRRISTPTRDHYRKISQGQTEANEKQQILALSSSDMASQQRNGLKLPPPPVPKKPKRNSNLAQNGSIKQEETVSYVAQENDKQEDLIQARQSEVGGERKASSNEKPEVAPKPVYSLKLNRNKELFGAQKNAVADSEVLKNATEQNLKTPLSFSERLKASSLSRRSEQNRSDAFGAKLRSTIISPVRRGSRSYMNMDTSLDREHETRSLVTPIPPKVPTEYNQKIDNQHVNQNIDNEMEIVDKFAEEQFAPLSVDSTLLVNPLEGESNNLEDTFDSKELELKLPTRSFLETCSDEEKQTSNSDKWENLNSFVHLQQEEKGEKIQSSTDESQDKFIEGFLLDNDDRTLPGNDKSEQPEIEAEERIIPPKQKSLDDHFTLNSGELKNGPTSGQKSNISSSLFSNVKRLKTNPREANNRRKFRPIDPFELHASKEEERQLQPLSDTIDTSTGMVVNHSSNKQNDSNDFIVDKNDISQLEKKFKITDGDEKFSMKAPQQDKEVSRRNPGSEIVLPSIGHDIEIDKDVRRTPSDWVNSSEKHSNAKDDTYTVKDIEVTDKHKPVQNDGIELGEIASEACVRDDHNDADVPPDFDVNMFLIAPPPALLDDMDKSDDEMTLDIIDPPTVYDDDDDDNNPDDVGSNIDFDEIQELPIDIEPDIDPEILMEPSNDYLSPTFPRKPDEVQKEYDAINLPMVNQNISKDSSETDVMEDNLGSQEKIMERPSVSLLKSKFEPLAQDPQREKPEKILLRSELILEESIQPMAPVILHDAPLYDSDSDLEDLEDVDALPPPVLYDASSSEDEIEFNTTQTKDTGINIELGNFRDTDLLPPLDVDGNDFPLPSSESPASGNDQESHRFEAIRSQINKYPESERLETQESYNEEDLINEESGSNKVLLKMSETGEQKKRSFKISNDRKIPWIMHEDISHYNGEGDEQEVFKPNFDNPLFLENNDKALEEEEFTGNTSPSALNSNENLFDRMQISDTLDSLSKDGSAKSSRSARCYRRKSTENSKSLDIPTTNANRLSPSSSFDQHLKSGNLSSRHSSTCSSTNDVDTPKQMRRKLSNRTWTSFNSSSGDEEEKKVNIVQLMKERTLTQDEGIDGVQLSFAAEDGSDHEEIADKESDTGSIEGLSRGEHDSNFEQVPLDEWTIEDVGDWLEMIGFGELREKFKERNVGGPELQAIDFQLLDDMGITVAEDRELILSEIYALKNPEDMDIEISLLDALDNASGYEREKMLALLEALKMSSEDNENRYLEPSPSPKISPRNKRNTEKSKSSKANYRRAVSEYLEPTENSLMFERRPKSTSPTRMPIDVRTVSLDSASQNKTPSPRKDKKSSKKRSFLKDAFSFRRKGSGKLARLFSSRKKLVDSSMKYLLQTSPQGIIKIFVNKTDSEPTNVSLLVTLSTTAEEITRTVLEKLEMVEDANCYYLAQAHTSKSVPEVKLGDDDHPLVLQCRWPDAERYRFEMKKKSDGSVIIVHSEEKTNDERSVTIETTLKTTCTEIMSITLKKLQKKDPVSCFSLLQNKDEKNAKGQTIHESQIPSNAILLKLSRNLSKPAVFRLIRINFIGSPEGVIVDDQAQMELMESLKDKLLQVESKLQSSNEAIQKYQTDLEEMKESKMNLDEALLTKDQEIISLENLITSLKSQLEEQRELANNGVAENTKNRKNELERRDEEAYITEIQELKDKIEDLENLVRVKEEDFQSARKTPNDSESQLREQKRVEAVHLLSEKQSKMIEELEEENKMLSENLAELETSLQEKNELINLNEQRFTAKIEEYEKTITGMENEKELKLPSYIDNERSDLLMEENESIKETLEELQNTLLLKENELQNMKIAQHENEILNEKMKTLENIMLRKDEKLQEMNSLFQENENLRDQVTTLERNMKQKERARQEAVTSQNELMELRRTVERLSDEVSDKEKETEEARQETVIMRERLSDDIDLKIRTIESLTIQLEEQRNQSAIAEHEKKELKQRLEEMELTSEGRRKQIDEMANIHEEYMGQHQRIKKLERELTIRSDELQQVNNDNAVQSETLRNHAESLEQNLLDKDSKILDLEFRLQKMERRLRESEDAIDDESREKNRLSIAFEDLSQKSLEMNKRVENFKRLITEKDRELQMLKGSQYRLDEKSKKEQDAVRQTIKDKDAIIKQLKDKMNEEKLNFKSQLTTLQKLSITKDAKLKKDEIRFGKEKEDLRMRSTQLDSKLNEKEASIRKLEAKVAKVEVMGRENMRKFEKFMSDKDRMLKQVKEDSERDIKDLKLKLRKMDENQSEKDRHIRQLSKHESVDKDVVEMQLKKTEEENKQNKYLLERLMSVVNDKDPALLEEFENSFVSMPSKSDKLPLLSKVDEDWC